MTKPNLALAKKMNIAAVIISMAALGMMAQNSELAVIRTAGVSKLGLSLLLIKSGLLLVAFALIIGEFVGEDWSIEGFLPGKIRGDQMQAGRASRRIQSREDA